MLIYILPCPRYEIFSSNCLQLYRTLFEGRLLFFVSVEYMMKKLNNPQEKCVLRKILWGWEE